MDGVLSFTEVLVLMDGSGKIQREVGIDDVVDCVCKRFTSVKEVELLWGDDGVDVISRGRHKWVSVDGESLAIGA